ncbi:MAG: PAS domain S-box protein [Mucilaginibacter sp.]
MDSNIFIEQSAQAIAIFDTKMVYLAASKKWLADYGLADRDIIGLSHYDVFPEIGEEWKRIHSDCLQGTINTRDEALFERLDGTAQWITWDVRPWYTADNSIGGLMMYTADITDRKMAEEKLTKTNRLYNFISQINQTILYVKNQASLFDESCRVALEFGKFKMAWIGLFENDYKNISLVNQSGVPDEAVRLFENAIVQANGPQAHTIQTGSYYICNDILSCNELELWKPFSRLYGIRSVMLLPIKNSGTIIGTFNLYSADLNFFEKEEIELLVNVTGDISFGVELFENEKKQKASEELVIKNEKRFRTLIEKSTDMQTLSTREGIVLYGSPSIKKVLGYSSEEILNRSSFEFIHPDDILSADKMQAIAQSRGKSFYLQQRMRHKNDSWVWCEGTITNLLHEPDIRALVSNFRDISEKKITEQQREFDKNNLNALINNTDDLMWSVDRDFNLITSNKPFDNMIRLMSGKDIEKGESIFSPGFSPEQSERYKHLYERAFAGESFIEAEYTAQPVELWSDISYAPIFKGDEIIGAACHAHNITARKKAEIERAKIVTDLMLRNSDLEQFAYIISHNLRAPVANILGALSALNDPDLDAGDKEILNRGINKSIMKLDEVVKDLNHILQVKGEINETKETVHFSELVDDIKISIKSLIDKCDTEVKYDFSAVNELLTLKPYLYSIFYNLISNSVKYRRQNVHSVIEITSHLKNNNLELIFKDNGLGIDLLKSGEEVFGLYKRFHTNIEGKGMGLFMVKTQVETLGGKVSIQSAEGKGTEFKIEFEI